MPDHEFETILNDETAVNEFEVILSLQFVTGFRIEEIVITDCLIDLNDIRQKLQSFNNYQLVITGQEVMNQKGQPLMGKFELEDKDKQVIYSNPNIDNLLEYIENNVDYIENIAKGGYFKKYSINYVIELEPKVLYKWGEFGYFCLINTDQRPYPYAKWLQYDPINKPFQVSSISDWYAFNEDGKFIGPDNQANILQKLSRVC